MGLLDNLQILVGNKKAVEQSTPTPTPQTQSKKILIVEDDKLLREFYVELMQRQGYTVLTAENGQIGLDTIQAEKPNLVLLDIMMPIMDGKTMLHRVRQIPEFKTLPVIVLTNAGDTETMRETQYYDNANAFLIKSNVNPEEIIRMVKSLA